MQINRLFEIVYILLDKKTVTAGELAERFEVSTRTIYRDVETLSYAGIPIYMTKGKGGGISLLPDFILNKMVLTEAEKNDILSSLKAVNSVNPGETNTALNKLNSLFGEANTDWIEVDFTQWVNADDEKSMFESIKEAIIGKNVLAFTYASSKGEYTNREVEPLKLCFKSQAWYLYCYCKTRCDYRFFKLRRIKNLHPTNELFKRKATKQIFTKKNVFDEVMVTLKLKLDSSMAFRAYDEFHRVCPLEDGSFIVEINFPRGEWLFNYVASFGEHCEVLEPEDVRLYITNKIRSMLQNYGI